MAQSNCALELRIMSESDLEYVNSLVKRHLLQVEENQNIIDKWKVKPSTLEGRGLIAVKDILVDNLIFVDYPLIMGPRIAEGSFIGCVVCYNIREPIDVCSKGCGLLVCSKACESTPEHEAECELLTSWPRTASHQDGDSRKLIRNIVPLRGLLLDKFKKDFLLQLAFHPSSKHGSEVNFLKENFIIPNDDESLMFRTCCVLDANAYEMILNTKQGDNVNLRGLFPVAALMNHTCNPNVRCDFDSRGKMYIRATKRISAGEEICTSYTGLLWGTTARRHHLKSTKDFLCNCRRCCDKTEFETFLGALRCLDRKCIGIILPVNTLDIFSDWCCEVCHLNVNARQIGALQGAIGGFLGSVKLENPDDMFQFLKTKISNLLPDSNHIVMELKWKIISSLTEKEGFRWNQLNTDWLNRAETLCRELLHPYRSLGLQRASQPARILLALHRCLLQKLRIAYNNHEPEDKLHLTTQELEREVVSTMNEAFEVLKYDIFAPKDLELRKILVNSDIRKLIEYDNKL